MQSSTILLQESIESASGLLYELVGSAAVGGSAKGSEEGDKEQAEVAGQDHEYDDATGVSTRVSLHP